MFCCIFNSCEAIKILEATKQKVFPEGSFWPSGYSFTIYLKVHRVTIIDAIGLGSECTKTENYNITHVESNMMISSQEVLKKQDYTIEFFVEHSKLPKEFEQTCLYYQENNKVKVIKARITDKPDLIVRDTTSNKIAYI